jgi:hypothetical protein
VADGDWKNSPEEALAPLEPSGHYPSSRALFLVAAQEPTLLATAQHASLPHVHRPIFLPIAEFVKPQMFFQSTFLFFFGPPLPKPLSPFLRPNSFTPKARNSASSPLIFVVSRLSTTQLGLYRALFLLRNQSQARLFFPLAPEKIATSRDGGLWHSLKKRLCGFAS